MCYQTVVCLSCLVRALWPNGWTDQDETWHAGRPRPWPHCVRWDPAPPPQRGRASPIFGPYVMAKWLDGLRCHLVAYGGRPQPRQLCVRWGPSSLLQKRGRSPPQFFGPCPLWQNGWMNQNGTWHGGGLWPRPHCARWGPSSPLPKRGQRPPHNFRPISIVAERLDGSKCHLIWR